MNRVKKPLIILTGPTAVGKTSLSIALAKAVNGEIISADSMQVYRHMDIGSAKIRPEEMQGVPHHLVDCLEPDEEFNVVRFQQMAKEAMKGIYDRGRIPVLVGGTGFYIQAVTGDIDFTVHGEDTTYRQILEEKAKTEGAQVLHEMLAAVDPASAAAIHANNVKRVIRALEYYRQTGKPISQHNEEQRQKESPYNLAYFVLNDERTRLYERIDARIDQMLADGLIDEVKTLKKMGYHKGMVSMQGLGYKEIPNDQLAWTQEQGEEAIVRNDGSILTPLSRDVSVLNADMTKNLWDFMGNPGSFLSDYSDGEKFGVKNVDNSSSVDVGGVTIQCNMPNVQNANDLLHELTTNKDIEKAICAMTIGRAMGGSSLAKYKYRV